MEVNIMRRVYVILATLILVIIISVCRANACEFNDHVTPRYIDRNYVVFSADENQGVKTVILKHVDNQHPKFVVVVAKKVKGIPMVISFWYLNDKYKIRAYVLAKMHYIVFEFPSEIEAGLEKELLKLEGILGV